MNATAPTLGDATTDGGPEAPPPDATGLASARTWRRIYLVAAVVIGLVSAFIRPPLSGTDEFAHFTRVMTLAHGLVFPATDAAMASSYRLEKCEWYLMAGTFATYHAAENGGHTRFGDQFHRSSCDPPYDRRVTAERSRSPASDVNPPTVFLPAAVGYGIAKPVVGPLLGTFAARILQLAVGIALTWLALRILPRGHALLVPLALVPTIAQVNGLVSPDAVGNAAAFIWLALLLRTVDESAVSGVGPDRRRSWQLGAAAVGLALAKPFLAPLLFAVFAIPLVRDRRWQGLLRSALTIVPALCVTLFWYVTVVARLDIVVPSRGADSKAGAAAIRDDPFGFLHAAFRGLTDLDEIRRALGEFVEIILRDTPGTAATLVALVGVAGIAVAWWASRGTGDHVVPRSWQRIGVVAAVVVLELVVIEYGVAISWDVPGASIVTGLQGRYLLPLVPLAYLATRARTGPPDTTMRRVSIAALALVLATNVWSLGSAYAHFYG